MPSTLRDFLLSFCPAAVRRGFPPESPQRTLYAATWGGLGQFFLTSLAFLIQLKAYFIRRAHELAPQLGGASGAVQGAATVVVLLEFLAHPVPFLSFYLAIEGFIRFMAGLTAGEVVPSFLVFLAFKARNVSARLDRKKQNEALLPDTLENLPDGRIRISSARAKSHWNASMTIGIHGQWFEVERADTAGTPPRIHVYCLQPAPAGKILRGYEEYDVVSAVTTGAEDHRDSQSSMSATGALGKK
jgi:hypothetical protein